MKHHRISKLRAAMVAGLALCTMLVAGCGSDVAPSADKVRLDLLDRVNLPTADYSRPTTSRSTTASN